MKIKYVLIGGLIGLIFCLAVALPLAFAFGKTGKNTHILNKDYSLLNKTEIITHLNQDFTLPKSIILKSDSREFPLDLSSISTQVNINNMVSDLLFRRLNQGLSHYFKAFFQPKNFALEINFQSDSLDQFLSNLSTQINRPFVPTELSLDPNTKNIVVKNGQLGQNVDTDNLKTQIVNSLQYYDVSSPINIPLLSVGSLPSTSSVEKVKQTAATLVGKSLTLTAAGQSVQIDDQSIISWLGFDTPCRDDKIKEYSETLKNSLKKDPVDAIFKFDNGKVLEFQPAENGYQLNDPTLSVRLCATITKLTQIPDKTAQIDIVTAISAPKVQTGDANNLGIKDLLGRGKSTFRSSTDLRNYNVAKGASIVNRVLVAPGDTFSFLKNLGDVSLVNGYKQGYVIKEGKTVLDVGGGICQVSTTLFRAMLNAGLDITSRQNHAYRVHYYEEDMPPGYDATVFIPSPDLKFVNDTGHYVLIQNTYNGTDKSLVYEIYGTSDGRQVDISNYRQWDSQPAPPAIYNDDPTLPAGKVVQDEHAIPGLKTAFDWKVTRNGEVIHQKTWQSSYTPWAAVYRRGVAQ